MNSIKTKVMFESTIGHEGVNKGVLPSIPSINAINFRIVIDDNQVLLI